MFADADNPDKWYQSQVGVGFGLRDPSSSRADDQSESGP